MHLCNLFDNNVISAEDYYKSVQKLQILLSNHDEGRQVIMDTREEQLNYWDKVGSQKQIQFLEQQKKIQVNAKSITPSTSGEKTTSTEKTHKKEAKSKHDDEKLRTAVVNLKNSKTAVTNSSNKKRDAASNKESNVVIKRRRSTLRGKKKFFFVVACALNSIMPIVVLAAFQSVHVRVATLDHEERQNYNRIVEQHNFFYIYYFFVFYYYWKSLNLL